MIIVVVDANRECGLSWVKDGWIYRFFSCTGSGLAGRPSCEDRPTCRSQGSSRRSGRFPALPYPPLEQMGFARESSSVVKKGVFPVSVSLGVYRRGKGNGW
jgi:hypothetical protein